MSKLFNSNLHMKVGKQYQNMAPSLAHQFADETVTGVVPIIVVD